MMEFELYNNSIKRLPSAGQVILAHQTDEDLVVYQAYRSSIADFAVGNQVLGGTEFSYSRMSWIKPNFLWMMYRCGWAGKENQEKVLAIWIDKKHFEAILKEAVLSSFNPLYYHSYEHWKEDLNAKEVRLQWDPDHDPYGHKQQRRAIQLGLRGKSLENFGKHSIKRIEDITPFVKQQKALLDENKIDELMVPVETIFQPADPALGKRIGITL